MAEKFRIQTMNHIAVRGIDLLREQGCTVSEDVEDPHAILLRSADLHHYEFGESLVAIGRSGAGTNNIPLEKCCEQGIVVFNSPGANAEAVKELILCSLVMSSRNVLGSIDWVKSLKPEGDKIPALVEQGKAAFSGPELTGKTLGVIGLGAVGSLIANIAVKLGMNVIGFDPYLSVDAAWRLSRSVKHAVDVDEIYYKSDYISVNVPFTDSTKKMLGKSAFSKMKQGVRIINESRAEIVDDDAMLDALASGKVGKYVTDFPNKQLIGVENVICMPHLGACTPESEEKSSVMAAHELYDYLVNGNIKNSVNFPDATLERAGVCRLCILHENKPKMLNRFLDIACSTGLNVDNMINKAYGAYAYALIDLSGQLTSDQITRLQAIPEVIRVRVV
ncbi:MAG: 3-phosphoglycerate dehydrogenase [Oscillospiraceae bacterium]|nr:3-phosphoglycerate dehydrogenase [Oscillospiraceae bacterium]